MAQNSNIAVGYFRLSKLDLDIQREKIAEIKDALSAFNLELFKIYYDIGHENAFKRNLEELKQYIVKNNGSIGWMSLAQMRIEMKRRSAIPRVSHLIISDYDILSADFFWIKEAASFFKRHHVKIIAINRPGMDFYIKAHCDELKAYLQSLKCKES